MVRRTAVLAFVFIGSVTYGEELIFESATLGPTGSNVGVAISETQWFGARFQVTSSVRVTRAGGHVSGVPGETMFLAIIRLSGPDAVPIDDLLAECEVVATTIIDPPFPSNEASAPLVTILTPGWYGILVGTEMFGAHGGGAVPANDATLPGVTYFSLLALHWTGCCANYHVRLFILGDRVPDSDADGIDDLVDECCETPPGMLVDQGGQPLGDLDGDCDVDLDDFQIFQANLEGARPGQAPCPSNCGDGIVGADEECDADGETVTCDADCTLARCGDGTINVTRGEECDDGNRLNGDGCDFACKISPCGNLQVDDGEQCDDGNIIDGDGCDTNCTFTACGNGIKTAPEECDDGNVSNGDRCDSNCTRTRCGNGVVTQGEECDDGNTSPGDGCGPTCQLE